MKIRTKIFSVFIAGFVFIFFISVFHLRTNVLQNYVELENKIIKNNIEGIRNIIISKREQFLNLTINNATWHETYGNALSRNTQYFRTNYNERSLRHYGLSFIFVLDKKGNKIFTRAYDDKTKKAMPFPEAILDKIEINTGGEGFLFLDDKTPIHLAFYPILKNENNFDSTAGTIGFGYYPSQNIISQLSMELRLPFKIYQSKTDDIEDNYEIIHIDEKKIEARIRFKDITGKQSIILSTEMMRDIYKIGKKEVIERIINYIVISTIFLLVLLVSLKTTVLNRLGLLSSEVQKISIIKATERRISLPGTDELSGLKDDINGMLDTISSMHEQISNNEKKFKSVIESLPIAIVAYDEEYNIVFWNQEMTKISGYESSEIKNIVMLHRTLLPHMADEGYLIPEPGSGEPEISFYEAELKTRREDKKIIEAHNMSMRFPIEGWFKWVILIDITARKLYEKELEEFASFDNLTGCYNRRMGFEILNRQMHLSKRNDHYLTICFIDVDGLKRVNDLHGHNEGDQLIKDVSKIVRNEIRDSDALCRIGGDEFLIILPETNRETAKKLMERIDRDIDKFNSLKKRVYETSFSYGFAEYSINSNIDIEKFVELADEEMYKHKMERKKNRSS